MAVQQIRHVLFCVDASIPLIKLKALMNIYLDVDRVLLTREGSLANHCEEFLEFFYDIPHCVLVHGALSEWRK